MPENSPAWLERTALLVGEEALQALKRATVVVAGLGGVGAYAAEMTARAGVGRMIIIDSDKVSESNRNRQLLALCSTLGRPKTEVMSERLLDINPELQIIKVEEYLTEDNVACVHSGIPLVSSMGAGAKFDATKVRLTDLSKSYNCPLAFILRKKLRKIGISKGFPVVFSEELPDRDAIVPTEGERNKKSQVGTISYVPAVFGCVCAQAALVHLCRRNG